MVSITISRKKKNKNGKVAWRRRGAGTCAWAARSQTPLSPHWLRCSFGVAASTTPLQCSVFRMSGSLGPSSHTLLLSVRLEEKLHNDSAHKSLVRCTRWKPGVTKGLIKSMLLLSKELFGVTASLVKWFKFLSFSIMITSFLEACLPLMSFLSISSLNNAWLYK